MLLPGMFRDAIRKLSLRKRLMILAAIGVFLPVLGLTYLQYRSLTELQNKTKGAFKDNLRQGLTLVEQRMKRRLEDIASQTLEPIASRHLSSPGTAKALEQYFAEVKRSHSEIQEIFVFGDSGDPEIVGLFDRARFNQSFLDSDRKYLFANSFCATCTPAGQRTFLFYPLSDSTQKQGSVAGVLFKEGFVTDKLLAGTVAPLIAAHSPTMAVTISDENRQVLYSNAAPQGGYLLESNLDRPFSNWRAAVGLKDTNLDALARDSFLHSAGATLLVLVFLLGGLALTLRATDREARLAQAKSNFVSNVSHELKTPLSLISLFSEILELGRVDNEEKKQEYYGIIRHESRRLNKTIDNILDFSRIEAGRKTYELVEGDMAEVIDNVLSTHRYQIITSGFDVKTNMQPELPSVLIDRDAMAQAISNLLDNAIKYSGEVKQLSITTRAIGSDLSLEVADHGIGIPRTEQAKVFDKFYRVGNGLVHDVKGSGLGLSLVKHIVEAHHGRIFVDSDVGKGSRFTILLPLARGSDGAGTES
jgi:signal transduction histidine kinase